jgi:23S rRNA (cytosine1962-C5)-methyltransferase
MKLKLKSSTRKPRVLSGHPWVFSNELASHCEVIEDGSGIELEDFRGRSLGMGIYNSRSQIIWRRYSRSRQDWNSAFISQALDRAIARRDTSSNPFCRLVWSESDDLPGLVVDRFNEVLVVQALTLAMDKHLPMISGLLKEKLQPEEIILRNDAPSRAHEGLTLYSSTVSGKPWEPRWMNIHGIEYFVDLQSGQKTGFYLDQQYEHLRAASRAQGKRVLDACCNQGAFALHCARAGASEVVAVDISADCVQLAKRNAERNQLQMTVLEENIFDYFTAQREERFDLIILDPPSFARNRSAVEGALRGYKELNLRAMRMLNPGGILATYSCSHHISRDLYLQMLTEAAYDSNRVVHVLEETMQPPDHPYRLGFPESLYLKGFWLRCV